MTKRYTDEERSHIYNKVNEAKSMGLDINAIFIVLADEYETNPPAIRNQYNVQDKRENRGSVTVSKVAVVNTGLSLIQKMKAIIKERDTLKENSGIYKSQRDDLQKSYNSLKSDHEKLLKEISGLEELL